MFLIIEKSAVKFVIDRVIAFVKGAKYKRCIYYSRGGQSFQ